MGRFLLSRPTITQLDSLLHVGWALYPGLQLHKSRGRRFWTRAKFLEALTYCCEDNNEKGKENLGNALKSDIQARKDLINAVLHPRPEAEGKDKEVIVVTTKSNKKKRKTL